MITSSVFDNTIFKHGFFTREGGISSDVYMGLNCGAGSNDAPENIQQNKNIAMRAIELDESSLATVYQIHSCDVALLTDRSQILDKPKADAMVTRLPGVALGILTADCVPILFADPKNRIIGAAHSGWKGTVANIARAVVEKMIDEGAERSCIQAVIGPSIQQKSYEVGPDFPNPFLELDQKNSRFFIPSEKPNHHMFDLTGFVHMQLDALEIGTVERLMHDTCEDEKQFFSYRRMYKKGEADYGRQLSAIALVE